MAGRPLRACASWEKAHSSVSDTERLLERLGGDPEVIRVDSSVKYGLVARGQADAYLRLPARRDYVEKIWDHAAGHVIVTEAGGAVSDIHGRPLDFSRGRELEGTQGVIVTRSGEHERIIEAIAALGIG
jgi:3'(2'), 5'-bisphosphate nucleotidase